MVGYMHTDKSLKQNPYMTIELVIKKKKKKKKD